ncbi:MAG: hypothetical protein ACR2HX_19410 [Pyrinomonadaceae bacterium]
MSRRKIPSRGALIEALKELDGNMAAVARRYHCDRRTVWQRVDGDPALRELVDELSETFIDEAENKLYEAIRDGNVVATIFFLKTKGRGRGYSERLELIPLSRRDIELELGATTPDTTDQTQALDGDGAAIALLEQ